MAEAASRLYVPALGEIYSAVNEYAEPILRIGLGADSYPARNAKAVRSIRRHGVDQ